MQEKQKQALHKLQPSWRALCSQVWVGLILILQAWRWDPVRQPDGEQEYWLNISTQSLVRLYLSNSDQLLAINMLKTFPFNYEYFLSLVLVIKLLLFPFLRWFSISFITLWFWWTAFTGFRRTLVLLLFNLRLLLLYRLLSLVLSHYSFTSTDSLLTLSRIVLPIRSTPSNYYKSAPKAR